ncbi:hypothetical protein [Rubellicoccus peritrichatus]|uniref:Uncharacterized protein n=1 Tax=Rubellicoccus peritrichatus TaxID=3080537 RepID=A0AAQ3QY30_9BACT|nr:hypothetical protein [Puniceicoccus sp. CR14]WOO43667.1 hypothetical protein RZN69_11255 [Puniceicoccus sp. CR14]
MMLLPRILLGVQVLFGSYCLAGTEQILVNPELSVVGNDQLTGWHEHNSTTLSGTNGNAFAIIPDAEPEKFAKLFQRVSIDDVRAKAIRVSARLKTIPISGAESNASKPLLRIYYYPTSSDWAFKDVIWPERGKGLRKEIEFKEDWQTVTFELERPVGANGLEVAIETVNPSYQVEVDQVEAWAVN